MGTPRPCKKCICLAICKNRKTYSDLVNSCYILRDYVHTADFGGPNRRFLEVLHYFGFNKKRDLN
jgi:hypothetical protein